MLRKRFCGFCVLVLVGLLFSASPTLAQASIYLDGQELAGASPVMVGGRTMVPMRVLFEALGANVQYFSAEKIVLAQKNGVKVSLQANNQRVSINDVVQYLDVSPQVYQGKLYVPLRFVTEALGGNARWDATSQTVFVTTGASETQESRAPDSLTQSAVGSTQNNIEMVTIKSRIDGKITLIENHLTAFRRKLTAGLEDATGATYEQQLSLVHRQIEQGKAMIRQAWAVTLEEYRQKAIASGMSDAAWNSFVTQANAEMNKKLQAEDAKYEEYKRSLDRARNQAYEGSGANQALKKIDDLLKHIVVLRSELDKYTSSREELLRYEQTIDEILRLTRKNYPL